MPRRKIPFVAGKYYHFYNRSNDRRAIFFERDNYLYFLQGMQKYLLPHIDILAYTLMPTHYHILGQVRDLPCSAASPAVSRAMMRLIVSYTKAINKRFARNGMLFQPQFCGKPVQTSQYLRTLCMYIHANPVKDGLVTRPEDWEFSDYREWMGKRQRWPINHAFIAEYFESPETYRQLITAFIETKKAARDHDQRASD